MTKLRLEEKEKNRDVYHQDELLRGRGITEMVARAVAATGLDQKKERKVDIEGVGLEALIPTDLTKTGGPEKTEKRQQLQHGRQLETMSMPKPKPNTTSKPYPAPGLRPAPTPRLRATSAPKGATTSAPTLTR